MRTIKILLIFLILAGMGFAEEAAKKIYTATVDTDGIQRVKVSGGEYFFDPNYIILKVNVPVELVIRKEPTIVPHNIIINAPEAGIDIRENFGKNPKLIKFTPKKTGKYPFYCDKRFLFFKTHKEKGMEGMIEVIE